MEAERILVVGTGWSGSSALIDILASVRELSVIPGEFNLFRQPGGIGDHILFPQDKKYLTAFQSGQLRNRREMALSSIAWGISKAASQGMPTSREVMRKAFRLTRSAVTKKDLSHCTQQTMERMTQQLDMRNRIAEAQEWLRSVERAYAPGGTTVVYDQPVVPFQHDRVWPQVFYPFKLVFVVRNPLDQLVEQFAIALESPQRLAVAGCSDSSPDSRGSTAVLVALSQQLERRLEWVKLQCEQHGPSAFAIRFESLSLSTEPTLAKLRERLGIEITTAGLAGRFDPLASAQNIGIGVRIAREMPRETLTRLESLVQSILSKQ